MVYHILFYGIPYASHLGFDCVYMVCHIEFVRDHQTPEEILKRMGEIHSMEKYKLTASKRRNASGGVTEYYAFQAWNKRENRREKSIYVPRHLKAAFDKANAAYEEYLKLRDQYEEAVIRRTRSQLLAKKRPTEP